MNLGLAFVNGKVLEAGTPSISSLDAGFQQGMGIYETFSVLQGRPIFLREHLARMESARRFLKLPVPRWNVVGAVAELLGKAGRIDAGLRITLTQGAAGDPTLAITLRPIPAVPSPLRLWISSQRKMLGDPWESVKTISRARNAFAREEAVAQGAFDALLPTNEGDLAEGSVSNFYLVRDGFLVTPPLDRGCLPGVTREKILDAAKRLGVPVKEEPIFPKDLAKAEEVLISNALIGICAVDEVIGHWVRPARPDHSGGALAGKLRDDYQRAIQNHLRLPDGSPELQ